MIEFVSGIYADKWCAPVAVLDVEAVTSLTLEFYLPPGPKPSLGAPVSLFVQGEHRQFTLQRDQLNRIGPIALHRTRVRVTIEFPVREKLGGGDERVVGAVLTRVISGEADVPVQASNDIVERPERSEGLTRLWAS